MFIFLSKVGNIINQKADTKVVGDVIGFERSIIGNILNIIRIAGTGLALVMLTWMSISYFSANGRGAPWGVEKQADIKGKQLRNFAIGVAIFIGASNILYLIAEAIANIVGVTFTG